MLENQTEINKLKSSLIKYFESENDREVTSLLKAARPSSIEIHYDSWHGGIYTYALVFELEIEIFQKSKLIHTQTIDKVLKAVGLFTQSLVNEFIGEVRFAPLFKQYLNWDALKGTTTPKDILQLIDLVKSIMISVSTGGPKIQVRENEYKMKLNSLNEVLTKLDIENPNAYKSLWDWYGRWSQPDLPSYAQRRKFVADMYQPVIDILEGTSVETAPIEYEPTGWERVDRSVSEMKKRLAEATNVEQFQAIGVLGRETLISTAQQVYDMTKHTADDGVVPSKTDAKRMLDSYLSKEIAGKTNECLRRFARSAVDMANELTHDRTAMKRDAALSLVSITAVTSLIKLIDASREQDLINIDDIPF